VALGHDPPVLNLLQNFRSADLSSIIEPGEHIALSQVSDRSARKCWDSSRTMAGGRGCKALRQHLPARPANRAVEQVSGQPGAGICGRRIRSQPPWGRFPCGGVLPWQGPHLRSQGEGRLGAGLVPATRRQVFERIKQLKTTKCPFANLLELAAGRWGQGLTAEKMKECVWLRLETVAQIEFLEWTGADHLRHTKFVGLRDDKNSLRGGQGNINAALRRRRLFEMLRDGTRACCAVWIICKVYCRAFSSRLVGNCASADQESPCAPGPQQPL
jgi:hypothetical protein